MSHDNKKTILLVEDEILIAMTEKVSLEKYGYVVITVNTGEKAIDTIENILWIDLILMDINLGSGIDGTEAAAQILKNHDLPLVFLSSHTEPELVEKTEKITSYGYVVKSSSITVLDASIKMAFKLFDAKINERKKENALRESEESLSITLQSIGDAVIATDIDGTITRMNPVAENLTGWKYSDAKGNPVAKIFNIINAKTRKPEDNPVKIIIESGIIVGLANHTILISRTGVEYQISNSGAPIKDKTGTIIGVVLVFRDVSEEYRIQSALQESERKFSDMVINSPSVVYQFQVRKDGTLAFTYISPKATELFGISTDPSALDWNPQRDLHPDDVAAFVSTIGQSISEIKPHTFEGRFITKGTVWFQASARPTVIDDIIIFNGILSDITERKLAEAELRESEESLSITLQSIGDAVIATDIDGTITRMNPVAENLTGWSFIDAKNKPLNEIFNIINVQTRKKVENPVKRVIDSGTIVGLANHTVLISNTGIEYQIADSGSPIKDKTGNIIGVVLVFRDVSEEYKIQNALQKSEENYRSLFKNSRDGIVKIGMDGRFLDFNDSYLEMLGYNAQELAEKTFKEITPPKWNFEEDKKVKEQIMYYGYSDVYQKEYIRKDGIVIAVELNVFLIKENGQNVGMWGIVRDITERKKAEEALRESEARFRLLFNSGRDAVAIHKIGKDGQPTNFIQVNDIFYKRLGYTRDEMLMLAPQDIDATDHLEQMPAVIEELLKNKQVMFETEHISKYGHRYPVEISTVLVQLNDNQVAMSVARDVTERKLSEEKIKALLAEKELILKEVHHRIRNNMNTIGGLLHLQASTLKDPSAIAALNDAENRVHSMMVLYDKLYQSVSFNDVSVKDYFPALVDQIIGNFPNSTLVKIEKHVDDFMIDANRLSSLGIIINELLTNIMKYAFTGRSAGLVTVSASLKGNRVYFVIADNGNGMPESINFENSTGFGLMLVEMLTKQIGGNIRIERENGTRIILEFEK